MNPNIDFVAFDKADGKIKAVAGLTFPSGDEKQRVVFYDGTQRTADQVNLMQYIGEVDRKGNKVYEDFFVRLPSGGIALIVRAGSQFFARQKHYYCNSEGLDCWSKRCSMEFIRSGEIIGNIWSNPEIWRVKNDKAE